MATYAWPTDISIGAFDAGVEYDVQFNVMRNGSITTYGLTWRAVGLRRRLRSPKWSR
jgi:hypothetical protein